MQRSQSRRFNPVQKSGHIPTLSRPRPALGSPRFNPVQKSGHIPTLPVQWIRSVPKGFNPVQKSGHIPTDERREIYRHAQGVLTPFKSPVISQHSRQYRGCFRCTGFNPVQKSGHIPTLRSRKVLLERSCFNPVQKSGHIPTRRWWASRHSKTWF